MRKRGRRGELEGVNLLELAPLRIAEWEEVAGRVVIHRPTPTGRGLRTGLDWLLYLLAASRIRLDETGSYAWRRLDGKHTIAQVAQELRERFGESVEPAEERLGHLVRGMRREGLLAYPGWDEPVPAEP